MVIQKEKKSCGQVVEEWKEFVWNPRTHQFMGRTGTSWAFILLFYLVFYGFLTAMFTLTMWVMLQTVSDHTPKYQDRLATPGLMIRPKTENLDVIVNVSDAESWDQHVQKLNKFLEPYNDSIQAQKNDVCRPGRYYEQPDNGVLNYPKRACQFNRTQLGDCSGIGDPTHYGYSTGQPCVFIKMNRVINFYAGANQSMNVTCVGKRDEDAENLGNFVMFPANGSIDLMYFPYYGKKFHVSAVGGPVRWLPPGEQGPGEEAECQGPGPLLSSSGPGELHAAPGGREVPERDPQCGGERRMPYQCRQHRHGR
uniref:Sodium/potassium-transporting ATPase subunit beta n=1 Tax=Suricata suricatta TaxID=37032 RepID=A0A673US58_SURSU